MDHVFNFLSSKYVFYFEFSAFLLSLITVGYCVMKLTGDNGICAELEKCTKSLAEINKMYREMIENCEKMVDKLEKSKRTFPRLPRP